MDDKEKIKEIKEFFATTSTEMLKKYYKDLLLDIIPKDIEKIIDGVNIREVINAIEEELSIRGEFKKSKKIPIQ